MKRPLRELSIIYWQGEETQGFSVYALRSADDRLRADLGPLVAHVGGETRRSMLYGKKWEVDFWDIRVAYWPDASSFETQLEQTLRALVAEGFVAAWMGLIGNFVDPPDLFDPAYMAGGVLAAYSVETGFLSNARLDQPLQALSSEQLVRLRAATSGLAQAE